MEKNDFEWDMNGEAWAYEIVYDKVTINCNFFPQVLDTLQKLWFSIGGSNHTFGTVKGVVYY